MTSECQDAIARNAMQNRIAQSGCYQGIVNDKHDIHRSGFLNVLVGFPIGPDQLMVALLLSQLRRINGPSVISSCFRSTRPSFNGPGVMGLDLHLYRRRIIRSYRTVNDHEREIL